MAISLGFRVRCSAAVRFRQWATDRLKEYDAFAERRRADAEDKSSERYLDDLAATAKFLESGSTIPVSKLRKPRAKKNV